MMRQSYQRLACMLVLAGATALLLGTRTQAQGQAHKDAGQMPACPLMGDPIDPSVKVTTDEGPLWFCCTGCAEKYGKDPAKYAPKLKTFRDELARLPKVQVTCPLSGEPIDPKVTSKQGDATVAFCCTRCKEKFDADPGAFAAKVANSYTIQTRCPFSNEPIDPKSFVEFTTGQRVYTCCGKCADKLRDDPAAAQAKLTAMGIHVDPAKVKKG